MATIAIFRKQDKDKHYYLHLYESGVGTLLIHPEEKLDLNWDKRSEDNGDHQTINLCLELDSFEEKRRVSLEDLIDNGYKDILDTLFGDVDISLNFKNKILEADAEIAIIDETWEQIEGEPIFIDKKRLLHDKLVEVIAEFGLDSEDTVRVLKDLKKQYDFNHNPK